jgi:hypothetical protein
MILPLNCRAEYIKDFLTEKESDHILDILVEQYQIPLLNKKMVQGIEHQFNFGKIMFIDSDLHESNALPEDLWGKTAIWDGILLALKEKVEKLTNEQFQVGVCIYYPDGTSGIDYHSDLVAFGDTSFIPSLSIGQEREFRLREKESLKEYKLVLKKGSLIIMGEKCQENYEHALPLDPDCKNERINITFRKYGFG